MSLTTVEFLQKLRQFIEREALGRDNTRKLYMAVTRAGQRLVISYVGELPEVIKSILDSK